MTDFERFLYAAPKEGSEAGVAELLRRAGARQQPPPEDVTAIKEAVRQEWRTTLAARPTPFAAPRKWLALAATLLLAVALGWWWLAPASPDDDEWMRVERIVGEARAGEDVVRFGMSLIGGTVVATGDSGSSLSLSRAGGGTLRLDAATRLQIFDGEQVLLEHGAVYFDSGAGADSGSLRVMTRFGAVRDIGTQFEARIDPSTEGLLRVRVREGVVVFEHEGESHSALAGEELRLREDGGVEVGRLRGYGEPWAWVQVAAPALKIDGQPLSRYLSWVARETGLEIRFAPSELGEAASAIVLRGTIEGLTPEESLALILPGSGLSYQIVEGTVLIAPGDG